MAANAVHLQEEGYRALKLKFSGDADLDVARVVAVRKAVGDDIMLMVDTNMSYSAKTFIRTFSRIDRYNIALAEQPVPAADIAGLKLITATLPIPIEADESAASVADAYRLVSERAVDVINLKVTKLGGLRNVNAAVNICEAGGVGCRLGAAFGPSLLQAFSAHIAGMFRDLPYPCELSEHLHLHDDPFTDFPCEDGIVPWDAALHSIRPRQLRASRCFNSDFDHRLWAVLDDGKDAIYTIEAGQNDSRLSVSTTTAYFARRNTCSVPVPVTPEIACVSRSSFPLMTN
jgi:L-alanine-DL-glutamate epimerase-like enolase superfamily enzyme